MILFASGRDSGGVCLWSDSSGNSMIGMTVWHVPEESGVCLNEPDPIPLVIDSNIILKND